MVTLKTLHIATEQQVFDQVAEHLLTQRRISADENEDCQYRSDEGLRCAAGCLIADDEYQYKIEGEKWYALANRGLVPFNHCNLIMDLQRIHDEFKPVQWELKLFDVAHCRGLSDAVVRRHMTRITPQCAP